MPSPTITKEIIAAEEARADERRIKMQLKEQAFVMLYHEGWQMRDISTVLSIAPNVLRIWQRREDK